jgi:ubiquinone/menaquinone biosynthesis C-methylase UbiE
METNWDYTHLAKAYLKRPDYSSEAINSLLSETAIKEGDVCCDVGAGVAHLTLKLACKGIYVDAVEPNAAMRKYGNMRTKDFSNVKWFEGTGEETGRPDNTYDIVTFGSSFNVTERKVAMIESARIAKKGGWFAVMWNHRDLEDPIQSAIENIIKLSIPEYGYGTRRENQSDIISNSGLFHKVNIIEGQVIHHQTIEDVVEAWKSHGTLHRQAGDKFDRLISSIEQMLIKLDNKSIEIPYTSRIWFAQLK